MKLHLANAAGSNLFTSYGDTYVAVNNQRYAGPLVVTPDTLHQPWEISAFAELASGHLKLLIEMAPEIIILGTGVRQQFPRPQLLKELMEARIGVEIMDTPAACRTYNILVSEGRKVIAAVFIG